MAEIVWTLQAIEDIESVAQFIARDSERYAQIQTERFFEKALILENHPQSGRIVPELNDPTIRELPF